MKGKQQIQLIMDLIESKNKVVTHAPKARYSRIAGRLFYTKHVRMASQILFERREAARKRKAS